MRTLSQFESDSEALGFAQRLSLDRSIELSAESLRHYGSLHKHWAIAQRRALAHRILGRQRFDRHRYKRFNLGWPRARTLKIAVR